MNTIIYERLKKLKPKLEREYHLKRLPLFGSHARKYYREDSDVDLIVEFSQRPTYFTLAGMKLEIEDYLGKDVDIIFEHSIFPELKDSILEDATDV
jgi:predicted nucleotidyltransferase